MMLSETYFVSGTNEELCGLLSCLPVELKLAIDQLKKQKVADIDEQNGNITLTSRKRKRDFEIRDLRRKAGIASGTKRRTHGQHGVGTHGQQDVRTPSASPSASTYSVEGDARGNPPGETPSWQEFWEFCQSLHCGIAAEWFAKDKYWAACQDNWKGKSDWRAYALRVRGWWDNDGRPMTPPKKNGLPRKVVHHLRDSNPEPEAEE